VKKKAPFLNYPIPDMNNLRAGVSFEEILPQVVCIDPYGEILAYTLLQQSDIALTNDINFDNAGTGRFYGSIPNSQAGTYALRLY
jgi:hypothetical protein